MAWWNTLLDIGSFAFPPLGIARTLAGRGGKDDDERPEDPLKAQLQQFSAESRQTGRELGGLGSESLTPVVQYFKDILSSNPANVMDATRQERGRVIDQYDTARKTIANFGPRGGGTTSTLAQSFLNEGQDLASVVSGARAGAVSQAGQLGLNLTGLGLSADQLASADLNTVLQAILNREYLDVSKRGQNIGAATGVGEAAGALLGLFLTRPGGIWGPAKTGTV